MHAGDADIKLWGIKPALELLAFIFRCALVRRISHVTSRGWAKHIVDPSAMRSTAPRDIPLTSIFLKMSIFRRPRTLVTTLTTCTCLVKYQAMFDTPVIKLQLLNRETSNSKNGGGEGGGGGVWREANK